ncbi:MULTISPECIES: phosphoribosylanthranilate isomerase [Vagococcus]|uniref:phosphoribosylanthranilate isomerase n=1 Tax=Vagococcus TaxID=2737 RepID=UPI000E4A867C|nr:MULTISPECIES: phosphoribosylanthranilate isomerase [Vagococcus]RHH66299.1 phosphoribosylanthranilate isomerase [Vagococcus sp. AM17-17]
MSDKFKEFLIITEELNKKNIIPLLMGSLGLEFVTEKDWNARDIDIHVSGDPRGWEAPDEERVYQWNDIIDVMAELNYKLIDLHEHEFIKDNISVEYGVIDTLPSFANVTLDELTYQNINNIEFYTPNLEAFLKIYLSSSEDSYRADNNNSKDFEKISYLKSQLT